MLRFPQCAQCRNFLRVSRRTLIVAPLFLALFPSASTRVIAAEAPPENLNSQIERGRVLLGLRDARAAAVLEKAAQESLRALARVSRVVLPDANVDFASTQFAMPQENNARATWRHARSQALQAHRWLAQARLGAQGEEAAIEAFATVLQLANADETSAPIGNASQENRLAEEARVQLSKLLQNGAPARATFATLCNLARFFYRAAPPVISHFSLPTETREDPPARSETKMRGDAATRNVGENAAGLATDAANRGNAGKRTFHQFAVFDAPLAPPNSNGAASTRVPPRLANPRVGNWSDASFMRRPRARKTIAMMRRARVSCCNNF